MHLTQLPFEALGGQPAFDPQGLERFVSARRIAVLSYTRRDGAPSQVPIWYRYQGGVFKMISATGAAKTRGLKHAGKASITIQDEMPPYRAVTIEGDLTHEVSPTSGGLNDWLAVWYFGKLGGAEFLRLSEDHRNESGLTQITLDPTRVRGFDNHKTIGIGLRLFMRVREALPIPRGWL